MKNYTQAQIDSSFKYLLASRVFRSVALSFVTLALPLYLIFVLHQDLISVGLVYFGIMLFTAIVSFSFGVASDSIGYAKTMLIAELLPFAGLLGLFLSTFITSTGTSMLLIVISAMLAGVSGVGGMRGSYSSGQIALIANNWNNNDDRINRMSRIITAASIASIVGGFLLVFQGMLNRALQSSTTELIANTLSYRYFFLLSTMLVLLSIICIYFVKEAKRQKKKHIAIRKASESYTVKVMISQAISGIGMGLALPILPALIAKSFSLSAAISSQYIGYVFGFGYLFIAISSFYVSRIIYRRKLNTLNVAAFSRVSQGIILVLVAVTIALLRSRVLIGMAAVGVLYVIYSAFIGIGAPMRQSINMKGIRANDYGTASAGMSAAIQLPQVSTGVSGVLSEIVAAFASLPVAMGGAFLIVGGIVYWRLLKRK